MSIIEKETTMDANEALLAIQELMDGVEWTPETLDEIATIMNRAGYRIRDLNDKDGDDEVGA